MGEKILEGRLFNVLNRRRLVSGVQVVVEKRPEVDLLKGVFFGAVLAVHGGRVGRLVRCDFLFDVHGGEVLGKLLQHRILDDLLVDHLAQFEPVQRQHADHLHQARRQNLLLRHPEIQPDPLLISSAHQIANRNLSPR